MATGDIIAQTWFDKDKKFDLLRTTKFFAMGTFIFGPWLRVWYLILNNRIQGSGLTKTVKMVLVDQIFMAPLFITVFVSVYNVLDGMSGMGILTKVKQEVPAIIVDNYKLWPAAQMVNFYVVPVDFRVLFANFVALLWNIYLSYSVNKTPDK